MRRIVPTWDLETLTSSQRETIAERREYALKLLRPLRYDEAFVMLSASRSRAEKEGQTWLRTMMLGKVCLINGGQALLNYWPEIKAELDIPWAIHHYERPNGEAWRRSTSMNRTFYTTNKNPDEQAVELNGEGWHPQQLIGAPGFSAIEEDDVQLWLGWIGGDLPEEAHPMLSPRHLSIIAVAGSTEVNSFSVEGGIAPFVWSVVGLPSWVTVDQDGAVTVAPPLRVGLPLISNGTVQAVGANGVTASAALNVRV